MIETLRDISQTLLREIGGGHHRRESLGRGASGDKTYPVDTRAEEIIIEGLRDSGRPMTVISEEAGEVALNGGGGMLALIDPIDGSNNAVTGVPVYASSVALAEGERKLGDVRFACVVNLVSGEIFAAQKNEGAFRDGERIYTTEDETISAVAYETSSPGAGITKAMPLLSKARRTRCLGAVALELCYLASGAFSAFVSPTPSRSFDFAGGWLIAKEAGAVISKLSGEPLDELELKLDKRSSFLASANASIHNRAMGLLS